MKIRKWLGEKEELCKKRRRVKKGSWVKNRRKTSRDIMRHQFDWNLKPLSNRLGKKGEKSRKLTLYESYSMIPVFSNYGLKHILVWHTIALSKTIWNHKKYDFNIFSAILPFGALIITSNSSSKTLLHCTSYEHIYRPQKSVPVRERELY